MDIVDLSGFWSATSDAGSALSYTLEVDWTNTGSWSDETARLLAVAIDRGYSSPLARVSKVGRMTLTMDNRGKQYSPALVSNALPRRPVRLSMTVAGVTGILFRGLIEKIVPEAGLWGGPKATIECVDAMALLDLHVGDVSLLLNARAHELIGAVVASVYTPPATAYDQGVSVFPVTADRWTTADWMGLQDALFAETDVSASRKIQDACASDWGRFHISKAGAPTFANRHRLVLNSTTAFTVADDCVTLGYEKDVAEVFNRVEVTVSPRSVGAAYEVIGRVDRPIKLEAGAAQTVSVRFQDAATKDRVGGYGVLSVIAGTDFRATSDEAGEGTDVTASVNVSQVNYSDRADVTLTNTSGAVLWVRGVAGGTGGLHVRGYAVRSRQAVTMAAEDASSRTAYQRRKLPIQAPLSDSESYAQRLADFLLAQLKDPGNKVRGVTLWANRDAASLAYARDAELLDRILVTEAQTGLSSYAGYVFGLRHTITGLAEHTLTLDLETAPSVGTPFQLGVSQMGGPHVMVF